MAEHSGLEIACLLKVAQLSVAKVCKELKATDRNSTVVANYKMPKGSNKTQIWGTFNISQLWCGGTNSYLQRQKITIWDTQILLLNKLKHQEAGMLWFFWWEKKVWSKPKGQAKDW